MPEEPKKENLVKKPNPTVVLASEYSSLDKEGKFASKIAYKANDKITVNGEVGTKLSHKDKVSASAYGGVGVDYKASETTTLSKIAKHNPIKKQTEISLASESKVTDEVNLRSESILKFDGKKSKSSVWNTIETTYNPHKNIGLAGGLTYGTETRPLLTADQGFSVKIFDDNKGNNLKAKAAHSFDIVRGQTQSVKGELEAEIGGKLKANVWGGGFRDETNNFGGAAGAGIKFKF
jgi:hypothetical protein